MKSVEIRYNRKNECEILDSYININEVARLKNLKSNRSIRKEISKVNESKYISQEVNTKVGKTYEILIAISSPKNKGLK